MQEMARRHERLGEELSALRPFQRGATWKQRFMSARAIEEIGVKLCGRNRRQGRGAQRRNFSGKGGRDATGPDASESVKREQIVWTKTLEAKESEGIVG